MEFRELVMQVVSDIPGVKVEIQKVLHAKSYGPVPEDTPLIQALAANWQTIMNEPGKLPINGVPLYTDARHFFAAGVPTIMFGVGPKVLEEANGHRADENIRLEDLQAATKIIACTLYDLLVSQRA